MVVKYFNVTSSISIYLIVVGICLLTSNSLGHSNSSYSEKLQDDPPATTPPVSPITIKPIRSRNYTVVLSYSGPAVLDSNLNFTAQLYDSYGHYTHSKLFHYEWSNNANHKFEQSFGEYQSSISKTFSSDSVNQGEYLMTVTVYAYGDQKKNILAHSDQQFILTDYLNAELNFNQALAYQRNQTIFATNNPILLKLNVTDKFDFNTSDDYYWYVNNTFAEYTDKPEFSLKIAESGNQTVEVVCYYFLDDEVKNRKKTFPKLNEACKRSQKNAKCGQYVHQIKTKDKLSILIIDGETSSAVNDFITLNATCSGSSPTGICWNATVFNKKHINTTIRCIPTKFENSSCFHQFSVQTKEKGWHNVQIFVYNDVSFLTGNYFVFAYNPDFNDSPMLTIPIVFSFLVTIIIIIGGVYLWKMKKKPFIEVADFEFHPSIARTESYVVLSDVMDRMKTYFKRRSNTLSVQSFDSAESSRQPTSSHIYETL